MAQDPGDLRRELQSTYDFGPDYPYPGLLGQISAEINRAVHPRRGAGRLLAGVAGVALAVLVVGVVGGLPGPAQRASRAPNASPSFPANLPPGVCAPTVEQLSDSDATRIEAKLVTVNTLSKSDPDFPIGWKSPPRSGYFWVVAELGSFYIEPIGVPQDPVSTPDSPKPFHFMLTYIQATIDPSDPETIAHPCRGIGLMANGGPWPAWFDQMQAIADVQIR